MRFKKRTKARRLMEVWLNTTGAAFKQHRPGETNYLSGLNSRGQRIREEEEEKEASEAAKADAAAQGDGAEDGENVKALKDAAEDDSQRGRGGRRENRGPDPKTLLPFPLNPHFYSQTIPSASLRTEVWKRVQVEGKSVRQVSVELGVEMRRVGAIVRLVELEKRMEAQVSRDFSFSSNHTLRMMSNELD
jgi:hypothetical protein